MLFLPLGIIVLLLVAHVVDIPLGLAVLALLVAHVLPLVTVQTRPVASSISKSLHQKFEVVLALPPSYLALLEVLHLPLPVELLCSVTPSSLYALPQHNNRSNYKGCVRIRQVSIKVAATTATL